MEKSPLQPSWVFLEARGYRHLSILENRVCLCLSDDPRVIYQSTFAELPQNQQDDRCYIGSHSTDIICVEFLGIDSHLAVTLATSVCKIWNLKLQEPVHTITNTKLSPTALSLQPLGEAFCFGCIDGKVSRYGLFFHPILKILSVKSSSNSFASFEVCSLKHYSVEFARKNLASRQVPGGVVKSDSLDNMSTFIANIVHRIQRIKMVVVTSARISLIDQATRKLDQTWCWADLGLTDWPYVLDAGVTVYPKAINFWLKNKDGHVVFFTIPCQSEQSPASIHEISGEITSLTNQLSNLTFLAQSDLAENSVLRKALRRRPQDSSAQLKSKMKKGKSLDQSITFGHPIKSSGYARQEPMRKMFQPHIAAKRSGTNKLGNSMNNNKSRLTRIYEQTDGAPSILNYTAYTDARNTPIYHLAYSPAGNRLAVALGSGACLLLRSSISSDKKRKDCKPLLGLPNGDTLCGHKGPVLCTSWSSDNRILLTSALDRTARLWMVTEPPDLSTVKQAEVKRGPKTMLVMDSAVGGSTNCYGERSDLQSTTAYQKCKTTSIQEPFPDCVQSAHFHYMDAFVYLVCRNKIHLFSYDLAEATTNILDKGRTSSFYKLARKFPFDGCNRITATASVNIFFSHLLFCAGSDHSLSVLDLNTETVTQQLESSHTRHITAIALNQGSRYSNPGDTDQDSFTPSNPTTCYSTFVTVAPGDCVRMWDLRDTRQPIVQFLNPDTGSSSTSGGSAPGAPLDPCVPSVGACFSPCGRHLTVGGRMTSNQFYPVVYDIRQLCAHPLAVLRPNASKVASAPMPIVAWHPSRPEIAVGSHDGQLATYVTA